jgi:hypothetical protein
MHLAAYWLPEALFWSVWPYTSLPIWLGFSLAMMVGSLLLPAWNDQVQYLLRAFWQTLPGKDHPQRWFLLLALCALPLFWLGRIQHLGWGDAQILVIGLSDVEPVIYNWQAPFTVFLHQRVWSLFAQPLFGWPVETVYAVISVICGGFFVYFLLNLAYDLGRTTLERITIAALVLTTGSMQLFFGYVENYTLISVGLILCLWLGVRTLRHQAPLWQPALALALTNACHPSTVVLWPAVIYLGWRRLRIEEPGRVFLNLTLPAFILGNTVLTLMEAGDHGLTSFLGDDRPGGSDHIWFVPLFNTRTEWERYTMFSPAHLLDWANEQFLISVFGLAILVIGLWLFARASQNRQLTTEDRTIISFLGIASFFYLLLTWVWNADYGIRKDWDLFAPSAFVYTLLAGFVLVRLLKGQDKKSERALAQAALFMTAVAALHTATWLVSNMWPAGLS